MMELTILVNQVSPMIRTLEDHRTMTSQKGQGRIMAIAVEENMAMFHQRSEQELLLMVKL
jgi:hypothetical protein